MSRASIGSTCCSSYTCTALPWTTPWAVVNRQFPQFLGSYRQIRARGLSVKSQKDHCRPCAVFLKLIQYPSHYCKVSPRITNPANFGTTLVLLCDWSVDHPKPDLIHFAVLRIFRLVLRLTPKLYVAYLNSRRGEGRQFPCHPLWTTFNLLVESLYNVFH